MRDVIALIFTTIRESLYNKQIKIIKHKMSQALHHPLSQNHMLQAPYYRETRYVIYTKLKFGQVSSPTKINWKYARLMQRDFEERSPIGDDVPVEHRYDTLLTGITAQDDDGRMSGHGEALTHWIALS